MDDSFVVFGGEEKPHLNITSKTRLFHCHTVHCYGLTISGALNFEIE